ncbi:N-acetyltransferase [Mucilaginibacter aquaedulcis]|uniref:N-acetyltransferase n=1 Tax=Mucilaginibacter aquaedulcis TaxID=1187081 RepID=UPI0025B41895|nr:N-acetyltransferase [Mucilaginibacter aquaedulcis]MDN3547693.1 N-acetyltransferase [Mucilaginibacter aquaedulcis]
MESEQITIQLAEAGDIIYADEIIEEMQLSAIARGSGISKRSPMEICEKILSGNAVIALTSSGNWVGFSYIAVWELGKFVSNSGLIVSPAYRNAGIAREIKDKIFQLSRQKYPDACIFSITSGSAIMKLNTRLGFEPVTYAEITHDEAFWAGCKSCVNYDVLNSKHKCNCLCTAMLFDPAKMHELVSSALLSHN